MFKIKLIFLSTDSKNQCLWSHQWVDWNGIDEIEGILDDYKAKEIAEIKENDIDRKITSVLFAESQPCDDNKYQCGSCDLFFAEPDDGGCPYCNSGNWVEGCIDEPEPNQVCQNECPNCHAKGEDIDWGTYEIDDNEARQDASCTKCNQEFSEVYLYAYSVKQ